jgi:hypothetical protein
MLTSANLGEVLSQVDFPSGPWTGFYNYGRSTRKHRMDLALSFAGHAVTGDGNDDIGRFFVTGQFDGTNRECYWTKTYIGAHDVCYRGFREGIWELWELPNESGGFHIWPVAEQEGEHGQRARKSPPHIEAIVGRSYAHSNGKSSSTHQQTE